MLLASVGVAEGYFFYQHMQNSKEKPGAYQQIALTESMQFFEKNQLLFLPTDSLNFDLTHEIFGSLDSSKNSIFQGFTDDYAVDDWSIFCFRGNHQRNRPSRGSIAEKPDAMSLAWEFQTAYDNTSTEYGLWGGGAGWTGQPMIIQWTKEQKIKLGIQDTTFIENDDALEVIIGSLCGNIYFLDAATGLPTRKHLSIGNPIKGSVSVDPRKNGLLYVGQGVQHKTRFGAYIFDMFQGEELLFINGKDTKAKRKWGAFDSNPLVDERSGQVFWPAENGLIYSMNISDKHEISPLAKMNYNHKKLVRRGIESSMAVIKHYGYFCDNSGSVLCIDLRTLRPVWNVTNNDDSDATIAVDREKDGSYYLYTGNEVDLLAPIHTAYFRKLDALTGEEIWKVGRKCRGTNLNGKTNSGGMLSSPAIGKNKGQDLVYCIFSRIDDQNRAEFLALNKATGQKQFSILMDRYSWSSPVDIYDEQGNIYIFFTDVGGTIYLVDGVSGALLIKEKTRFLFESSPVIINNQVFIASRGQSILSYKLEKNTLPTLSETTTNSTL